MKVKFFFDVCQLFIDHLPVICSFSPSVQLSLGVNRPLRYRSFDESVRDEIHWNRNPSKHI